MTKNATDLRGFGAEPRLSRRICDRWDSRHPDDAAELRRVLTSGSLTGTSASVTEYETAFAKKYRIKYALAVSSGSAAVMVSLVGAVPALEDPAQRGPREVILAPTSPLCTVFSLLELGVRPIFADTRPNSFGLDPSAVEAAVTRDTVAILEVPMWGYPTVVNELRPLADRYGLPLVLDLAHSHMVKLDGLELAAFGDVAGYSTHDGKFLSTGEGGMVVTNDPERDDRMRAFTRFGNLNGTTFGLNFKLSGAPAALGLARLRNVDRHAVMRRRNREFVLARLRNPHVRELPVVPGGVVSGYALLVQAADHDGRRLVEFLDSRGIPSDIKKYENKALYEYPLLAAHRRECPRATTLLRSLTTIPLHPDLTDEDLVYISEALNAYAP